MAERSLLIAQHEAAHVVVGVALGLRLHLASALPADDCLGYAWFPWGGSSLGHALCTAAGVAWEVAVGGDLHHADLADLRRIQRSASGVRCAVRAAAALLTTLGPVHARVTRALLERDLRGQDIASLARGERLSDGE